MTDNTKPAVELSPEQKAAVAKLEAKIKKAQKARR
jgi:hypothetical protein